VKETTETASTSQTITEIGTTIGVTGTHHQIGIQPEVNRVNENHLVKVNGIEIEQGLKHQHQGTLSLGVTGHSKIKEKDCENVITANNA